MRCRECNTANGRYEDPRDPPLDVGECLCAGCFRSAAEERIDDLLSEASDLREQISKIGKPKAPTRLPLHRLRSGRL